MTGQPTGTVTLVFTDIAGSTRLLRSLGPERYRTALAEHRAVVRDAFARHDGYEVDEEGDAFFFAFASATRAVSAVEDAFAALDGGPIRIRVGIHTGEPIVDAPKYVGEDVHKAARIMSAAHGGQIVLSAATRALLDGHVTELGEHRLKDFDEPVSLFQVGAERFPPLRTLSNTNLPSPATKLVGRERETSDITALVRDGTRLVTLTGPGGAGKTRLGLAAARELVHDFEGGVFWIALAPVRDPELALTRIAVGLGTEDVAASIGHREVLLLLDNFEQVIDAAPGLGRLLAECPNLSLIVTSRELLRIQGETGYLVPPLAEGEAVELFTQRTGAEPSPTITELCRRLDNLPLAIELAAARTGLLSPEQLLDRISQRLDLLRAGRDSDPRQQTLRTTIQWSFDLLTPEEQLLLSRLTVFAGGWELKAAEEVAGAELSTLESLLDKSLVRRTGPRCWLLETIREFAAESLADDEHETLARRHCAHYVDLAERAEPELDMGAQEAWLSRLETERGNLEAALAFAFETRDGESAVRLTAALRKFWLIHGPLTEAGEWLERSVRAAGDALPGKRADALGNAAFIAYRHADYLRARLLADEGLALSRALGDRVREAEALDNLANAAEGLGDFAHARELLEQSLELKRAANDTRRLAHTLAGLADVAMAEGLFEKAIGYCEEAIPLLGADRWNQTIGLLNLSSAAAQLGRPEAIDHAKEALGRAVELGDRELLANALDVLAWIGGDHGRAAAAARLLGYANELREQAGAELEPSERRLRQRLFASLGEQLDGQVLAAELDAGRRLTTEGAVALADG
jgi:predicted ATPase